METYLLIKYLKCSVTQEEEKKVKEWLADDPDGSHAKQYSDAHFLYEGMLLHDEGGFDSAREESAPAVVSGAVSKGGRLKKIVTWAASAAAVLLLMACTGLWVKHDTEEQLASRMETVYVPAGKSMELTLEDGTRVWLNSGTRIEYPAVFSSKSRNVKIYSGEVLFDVAHDEKRPFNVDTYASSISVLGTKFNMAVDEQTGDFSVALLRGLIRVSSKFQPTEDYVLRPNQMVRMKNEHLIVERIADPDAVGCWTNGLIDVSGVPFDQLMRKFELAYDVRVVIDRAELPQLRYTRGKLRISDGVDHALSMLSIASDFEYEYDRRTGTVLIK